MKKRSLSQEKKLTWDAFSKFIRRRDAIDDEWGSCITCGRTYPIKSLQAGHFIAGRHNSILFDERNCHSQCYGCNVGKKGNVVSYYRVMLQRYGQGVIDELEEKDQETRKFTIPELQEMRKDFTERTSEFTT